MPLVFIREGYIAKADVGGEIVIIAFIANQMPAHRHPRLKR